ncbi:hypothetical protein P154DRAFT_230071 [Amniculicola lignicola CBS 123094]|uniref:Zn(2)-C6 fungal-type domain-containing protein n=1 Tax=Amniculicola lignicola CBS 123094 TaxID=1392246 RepID=A0A6A5WD44_9PLEO|nr:hypothetical protein P154DRAFT_230071 [Amniculicola lignicola CBS 123094]
MEDGTGIPAAYGHACAGCSRAKNRCVTRAEGGCERCHRLGKECTPAELKRKRGPRKTTLAARRSQLEDKLSDLVSLLQAQHALPPTNDSMPIHEGGLHTGRQGPHDEPVYQTPARMVTPVTMASKSTGYTSPISNIEESSANADLGMDEEQHLHTFRTSHLKCFPLMHLSEDITPIGMEREWPFLWMTIQGISNPCSDAQAETGNQIRNTVATKIIVEGERNLDLLFGLLVYTSWSFYFFRGKPMLGVLTGLIKSVVRDLRLDRPAVDKSLLDGPAAAFTCVKSWTTLEPYSTTVLGTSEGRRALLASFVLTTTISLHTGHRPVAWGPQMDDAILQLTADRQCSGDEVLVAMARISKVSEDASVLMRLGFEYPERLGSTLFPIQLLRGSLEQVRTLLSPEMLQNRTVLSHLYCAEIMIHELALFQIPAVSYSQPLDYTRFEYLHTCLRAIRSSLDNFLVRMETEIRTMNFFPWLQFSHYIQVLQRLSCLQHPGWDRHLVRESVDVIEFLQKVITMMEAAYKDKSSRSDNEAGVCVLERGAAVLKASVPLWVATLEKSNALPVQQNENGAADTVGNMMDDHTLMDFTDDSWFTDVFGSNF